MRVPISIYVITLAAFTFQIGGVRADAADQRPNILVIMADDLGYADVGFNGCKDIPTPHLDALAKNSVRCTSGYVTHPFCSPTRAGLLSGRYQQRFGHENNPAWLPENTVAGFPLSETTLPQVLKDAGYRTGAVGKWHLGAHPQFHPNRRGFDEYFGLLGGGHVYLSDAKGGVEYSIPMDRNGQPEPLEGYLTEVLGNEASDFVNRNKSESTPWFLYLAFNAPHTPLQSTAKQLDRVRHINDETRRNYAGLVIGLDDAIGTVIETLQSTGQIDNTIIWFMSDNGGPTGVSHSDNTPLRGAKGQLFEGGIRVPFLVSWPRGLPAGQDFPKAVISLDVFATSVAVSNAKLPEPARIEGVNLVPYLAGAQADNPHERLFWRTGGGQKFAVWQNDWKLVAENPNSVQLFNLSADIAETRDVSAERPDILAQMKQAYAEWNQSNIQPLFESPNANAKNNAGKRKAANKKSK